MKKVLGWTPLIHHKNTQARAIMVINFNPHICINDFYKEYVLTELRNHKSMGQTMKILFLF